MAISVAKACFDREFYMGLSDFTRKQAFLTHLLMSMGVFFVISYLIFFHWYPDFYFLLDGGDQAIATIFFVDVVLGPGLTLLVFKPGKKSLKFDMTVILLLQLSALSWGVNTVYTERSGISVSYLGKFACVSHSETAGYDMDAIAEGPSGKQRLALLQRPDTMKALYEFTKEAYENNAGEIYHHRDKVVPLDADKLDRMENYELDQLQLKDNVEHEAAVIESYINSHPGNNESYKLMPLLCRYGKGLAVYDKRELRITEVLDIEAPLSMKDLDFDEIPGMPVRVITK